MGFRVVCISRTLAAGGEVVGRAVAQRLGFRYIDEEVVTTAAEKAHVDASVVAAAEHKQPFIKRLIAAMAVQGLPDPSGLSAGLLLEPTFQATIVPAPILPEEHRALIREAIREIANEGDAVIVAHAASMALAGTAGVLRVLVTASPRTRAERLAAAGERDAEAAVAASDHERRDYFRLFYKIKEELPMHYDLVVNTDALTPEEAVRLIVSAARGG